MRNFFRISLFLCSFVPMVGFAQADENNGKFASFIYGFLNERGLVECRTLSNGNLITLINRVDKPVNIMCNWYPITDENSYRFPRKELIARRKNKVDYVLVGYGQRPDNPLLYYLIPASKVRWKVSEKMLKKYQIGIPVCDLSFVN